MDIDSKNVTENDAVTEVKYPRGLNSEHTKEVCHIRYRLTVCMLILLAVFFICLTIMTHFDGQLFLLIVLLCGMAGGFVSIQQRVPHMPFEELYILNRSYISLALSPIIGGIFAFILLLMFIGDLVSGAFFPEYKMDVPVGTRQGFRDFIENHYPESSQDVAKLLFWSFMAGFSERFVVGLINSVKDSSSNSGKS